jgi:hypothetical protein
MAEKVVSILLDVLFVRMASGAFAGALDEIVDLGDDRDRRDGAKDAGVKSVPALVVGGAVDNINCGAELSARG